MIYFLRQNLTKHSIKIIVQVQNIKQTFIQKC